MRRKAYRQNSGFTFVETLVYLGLFGLIMGGALSSVYVLMESGARNQAGMTLENEAEFLQNKINWALTGADSAVVTRSPLALAISNPSLPFGQLVFDLRDGKLRLKEGDRDPLDLNCGCVKLTNLDFSSMPAAGGKPQKVVVSFALSYSAGAWNIERAFAVTKYLQ